MNLSGKITEFIGFLGVMVIAKSRYLNKKDATIKTWLRLL